MFDPNVATFGMWWATELKEKFNPNVGMLPQGPSAVGGEPGEPGGESGRKEKGAGEGDCNLFVSKLPCKYSVEHYSMTMRERKINFRFENINITPQHIVSLTMTTQVSAKFN
jgi:hypothetical protein